MNTKLVQYCDQEQITFTRGRPYKKNDQCYVEQKNGLIVHQLVGYDRFEGQAAYRQLNEMYRTLQRRVKQWRASALLQFDDAWFGEEVLAGVTLPPHQKWSIFVLFQIL